MRNKRSSEWNKNFNFNVSQEKVIYRYVCREKIEYFRKRDLVYKFDTYMEWKNYVRNKYMAYNEKSLMEFSRYLNYQLRRQPDINGVFALCLAPLYTWVINFYFEIQTANISKIVFVIIIIPWVLLLCWMLKETINMSTGDKMNRAFYEDYKEIIDELILEKLSTTTTENDLFESQKSTKEIEFSHSHEM
ncbi:MAG: hypothetical protein J6K43_06135 [Lachnospiraceae bacterium]|nr:hypothetical protein [Lachnospiraceae bacterium]